MTRRLLGLAYSTYPDWWRDRYGEEARELAEQLAGEGRSGARLALDVAGDGLRHRLRRAPAGFGPPARTAVQRAAGRSLSSVFVSYVLLLVALSSAAAAHPEYVGFFRHPSGADRWLGLPGLGFVLVGRVALAVGAGLFVLAGVASFSLMLLRALRARDARSVALAGAVASPAVLLPAIADLAVKVGQRWVEGGPPVGLGQVPQVFGMILTGQRSVQGVQPMHPLGVAAPAAGPPLLVVLCLASWLAVAAVGALAIWGARGLRRRAGLPPVYLRLDALLVCGAGWAAAAAWVCLLGWGLSTSAAVPDATGAICVFGVHSGCYETGPVAVITAVWWAVVASMGLACARAVVTGGRAMRQLPRLATA